MKAPEQKRHIKDSGWHSTFKVWMHVTCQLHSASQVRRCWIGCLANFSCDPIFMKVSDFFPGPCVFCTLNSVSFGMLCRQILPQALDRAQSRIHTTTCPGRQGLDPRNQVFGVSWPKHILQTAKQSPFPPPKQKNPQKGDSSCPVFRKSYVSIGLAAPEEDCFHEVLLQGLAAKHQKSVGTWTKLDSK